MTGWPTGWELAGSVGTGSSIAWQVRAACRLLELAWGHEVLV